MSPAFPPVTLTAGGPWHRGRAIVVDVKHRAFIRGLETVAFEMREHNTAFRLFAALIARAPGIVGWRELIDHVYGDRPDGGAATARKVFSCTVAARRQAFARLGIGFASEFGIGMFAHDLWAEARRAA